MTVIFDFDEAEDLTPEDTKALQKLFKKGVLRSMKVLSKHHKSIIDGYMLSERNFFDYLGQDVEDE